MIIAMPVERANAWSHVRFLKLTMETALVDPRPSTFASSILKLGPLVVSLPLLEFTVTPLNLLRLSGPSKRPSLVLRQIKLGAAVFSLYPPPRTPREKAERGALIGTYPALPCWGCFYLCQ